MIVVDIISERAARFYESHGFTCFPHEALRLFLEVNGLEAKREAEECSSSSAKNFYNIEGFCMTSSLHRFQELSALADAQAGYFTAAQALNLGYSYPTQHHHAQQGSWQRTRHGLYRLSTYPLSPYEHLAELSLWSRNRQGEAQAVVSHHTALAFHELSDLLPEQIHLSVPRGFRKVAPPGVQLHTNEIPVADQQTQHGFQVTSVLRTLRDMVSTDLSSELLDQAIDQALERGMISPLQAHALNREKG